MCLSATLLCCVLAGILLAPANLAGDEKPLPRFQDILNDIKSFTARVKRAETEQQRVDALVDLSQLYLHIVRDPRFARSQRLQGYRGRIAARLRDEQKQIERQLKKLGAPDETSRHQPHADSTDRIQTALSRTAMDQHWQLLCQAVGGAAPSVYHASGQFGTTGYFANAQIGRRGGIIGDHGRELVNLIETILHPDFWQTNGGAGMVYYYQPLRILVVRATTTVHEDLTDFLELLR